MSATWRLGFIVLWALAPAAAARADEGWSLLRSENEHVRTGNERLRAGDAKGALAAYDLAARELPSEGGVHLDRGLALLRAGELSKAREALQLATQPPAATNVRADAYYNLGSAFYKEGEAQAAKDDPEQAQKSFREAADALKQALRLRPGDRNAAWNYELALRRIEEQKKKLEERQQQDQQQDQQQQDQQQQDQQGQQDQQQQQDKQGQQDQQDQQSQQGQQDQQDQQGQQDQQEKPQQPGQNEQQQAAQDPEQGKQPPPAAPQQQAPGADEREAGQRAIPRDVERALDALENGEQSFERIRAMQRAARNRRPPEKDW